MHDLPAWRNGLDITDPTRGVTLDAKGDLYTCDITGKRAQKLVRKTE
jgi:hypothetical protein